MAINTLLFDLDGTLIDTNELIIASFLHTLEQYYPSKYKQEHIYKFIGCPLEEAFAEVDENRIEEMIETYRKHNIENHDLLVKEYDGVFETIQGLHEKGYKLGIVTSKVRKTVNMGLKLTKLDQFFDVVVTVDDVKNAKPNPEGINLALSKLHASIEEAIMVGDNHHDIVAGKNAGTLTAGVAWAIKGKDHLAKYQPDYMLDHMSDLYKIVGAN